MARATTVLHATEKPMEWGRAFRALRAMKEADFATELICEFAEALDGGDQERSYQSFLADPGAVALVAECPDLAARLDDSEALAAMPEGSLGRAVLELFERDHIEVRGLARGMGQRSDVADDPQRQWFRERMTASHDLLHALTGYDRDVAGESALLAFTNGIADARILRVSLLLSLFAAPKRRFLRVVGYLYRAYRRGRRANIPRVMRYEDLLPLPIERAREILGIEPTDAVHPEGVWRSEPNGRGWVLPREA